MIDSKVYADKTNLTYDFRRCTYDQLLAYVVQFFRHNIEQRGVAGSKYTAGLVVLDAAQVPQVPQEHKEDVAREIAEFVVSNGAMKLSAARHLESLADRYKAAK